jgi:hypothetical protein
MRIGKYQHISVPLLILNISFFENHQCIAKAVSISFMATLQENRSNQSAALKCASGKRVLHHEIKWQPIREGP